MEEQKWRFYNNLLLPFISLYRHKFFQNNMFPLNVSTLINTKSAHSKFGMSQNLTIIVAGHTITYAIIHLSSILFLFNKIMLPNTTHGAKKSIYEIFDKDTNSWFGADGISPLDIYSLVLIPGGSFANNLKKYLQDLGLDFKE